MLPFSHMKCIRPNNFIFYGKCFWIYQNRYLCTCFVKYCGCRCSHTIGKNHLWGSRQCTITIKHILLQLGQLPDWSPLEDEFKNLMQTASDRRKRHDQPLYGLQHAWLSCHSSIYIFDFRGYNLSFIPLLISFGVLTQRISQPKTGFSLVMQTSVGHRPSQSCVDTTMVRTPASSW